MTSRRGKDQPDFMLNITVLCVGKCKEAYWREACAEYVKRLSAFCRLSVTEVEEERLPERPSQAQIDACLAAEGKRLLDRVPPGAAVVALCIEGKPMTSPAFSALLPATCPFRMPRHMRKRSRGDCFCHRATA